MSRWCVWWWNELYKPHLGFNCYCSYSFYEVTRFVSNISSFRICQIPAVSMFSLVIGCFLRPWSGSMTLGSFTCPHTHPPAPVFTTRRNCWKSMKTSRSQQRYVCVCVFLCWLVDLWLWKRRLRDCKCLFLCMLICWLCVGLHSPACCCEAHSLGTVLFWFLFAVSLLLC